MTAPMSLREAARLFVVSRPTLVKWIKAGKISATPGVDGNPLIDPAEMLRLGIAARASVVHLPPDDPVKFTNVAGKVVNTAGQEIEMLRAQLADAEQRAAVAEALANERAGLTICGECSC